MTCQAVICCLELEFTDKQLKTVPGSDVLPNSGQFCCDTIVSMLYCLASKAILHMDEESKSLGLRTAVKESRRVRRGRREDIFQTKKPCWYWVMMPHFECACVVVLRQIS